MRILASPAFANKKVNPYNALLYSNMKAFTRAHTKNLVHEYSHKKAILEKFDIVHFHWPDGYINQKNIFKALQRSILLSFILMIVKLKGSKIVWTVHNVAPHDAFHPRYSQAFMRWFARQCDGLIFMSEESKATFFSLYNCKENIHYAIIPHGHYRNSYPDPIDQAAAKNHLGLPQNKQVLLFFGMIKPYKNIDLLMELFTQAKLFDYVLVVAGNTDSPELKERLKQHAKNPNIHLLLQFIPDDRLHIYLSAADAVILPYKSILNSGALLLALSFNKPVIAPHIGAFVSLQQELGRKWIYSYAEDLEVGALKNALRHLEAQDRSSPCPLENYDWDKIAASTLAFYRQLFPISSSSEQALSS
ncbi:peptidase M14 [Cellvibrio zantedeschiae]|uniref:Peptidase M14 n=1 Tax=Cellvibrio zantedeschiae TaxID=1237077 RepID=A0ABQ3B358_9GAMM|nr:glycosyltransferase family 4 protein [Cellvibrio zantedeschiae]GGY74408.1 peptidase M14 [Cellvibrio zantedeschiae]